MTQGQRNALNGATAAMAIVAIALVGDVIRQDAGTWGYLQAYGSTVITALLGAVFYAAVRSVR